MLSEKTIKILEENDVNIYERLEITNKLKSSDMHNYICTISITDCEQIEKTDCLTKSFLIRATTFKEALEQISSSFESYKDM